MNQTPEGMSPDSYEKFLKDYRKEFPGKIKALREASHRLESSYNKEDLTAVRFIVHKIAGNGAIFGYPEASRICLEWDTRLSKMLEAFTGEAPSGAFFKELNSFINHLEKTCQKV
ncbi:MAG: Hpt domain-containing protein [Simkaniaceae bacterium]|nr:Hpt domain-containing protein [Simkaniaceae bacterium]